jgi:hypothetical protein
MTLFSLILFAIRLPNFPRTLLQGHKFPDKRLKYISAKALISFQLINVH